MMRRPFGRDYAKYYDLLYADKDYRRETDYLIRLFKKFSDRPVKRILDLSSGTGGHAIEFAKRGYEVLGLDNSRYMVELSRKKARRLHADAEFKLSDMRSFRERERFDACICMFDSICYLADQKEVIETFKRVRRSLRPNSLFILQYWNGVAVLTLKPANTRKAYDGEVKLERFGYPRLRPMEQVCEIEYRIIVRKGNERVEDFKELHRVRFFFPEEVKHLLAISGLRSFGTYKFMSTFKPAATTDWSVCCVAKRG